MSQRFTKCLLFALIVLSGCHLFSSGEIDKTCDEVPGCMGGQGDTGDTGAPDGVS